MRSFCKGKSNGIREREGEERGGAKAVGQEKKKRVPPGAPGGFLKRRKIPSKEDRGKGHNGEVASLVRPNVHEKMNHWPNCDVIFRR